MKRMFGSATGMGKDYLYAEFSDDGVEKFYKDMAPVRKDQYYTSCHIFIG